MIYPSARSDCIAFGRNNQERTGIHIWNSVKRAAIPSRASLPASLLQSAIHDGALANDLFITLNTAKPLMIHMRGLQRIPQRFVATGTPQI
jgi:hypothetical protein